MWLIKLWRYLIMLLLSVHLSFQNDEQPSIEGSMMKKYNRMLQEKLSDFLETQLQVLLDDTITDLIQNKLPNIIDDRLSKIIGEKLNEHVTVMERFDVLEYMQSDLSNTTYNNGVKLQNHQELMNESFIIVQRKLDSIEEKRIGKLLNTTGCIGISTCDVARCDIYDRHDNTECWDNDGQQQAECRCKTGYISIQNQCTVIGCSEAQLAEGFFQLPLSEQCLKHFTDETRSWSAAKAKCESEGLALVKIHYESDAIILRKYMVDNGVSDDHRTWVGGHRNESGVMRWVRGSEEVSARSYVHLRSFDDDPGNCLALLIWERDMQQHPDTPYGTVNCIWPASTLCEVISE